MALNKKKLMGLLAMLDLLEDEEDPQSTPMPGGILEAMEGRRSGNPRDDMVPLINWQGDAESWQRFLENWRRGGAAPQSPVAPGADRHPPMPPQNNFSQMPGMPDPFGGVDGQYGIDKSSPMPMPEGIEPFNTIPGVMDDRLPRNQMQTLEGDLSMMRQIDPRGYEPMAVDPSTLNESERRDYMEGLMGDRYTNVYGTPEIHGPGMRVAEPVGSDYAKHRDKDWGEGLFEASTRHRGQAPFLDDPQVKIEIFNAARAGGANPQSPTWHDDALERVVEKYGLATVQRVINEESAAARFHMEGDNAPWEVLDSSMRELNRISDEREGVANEDRGNPLLTAQGVVDPETGQRRVSTPVGQPIPQPNEEVGFMDREISDHGQKMRNVMDAYYGGADFGYETEWAEGLGVAQKEIDNFMAALNSGDIDAAMQSPTDFMLEEFERKWGWPLNVNSSSYTAPESRAPYREPDIDETHQPRYPEWTPSVDRLFGPGNFEMSTQFRGQAPGLNDPRVRREILEASSKGAIESIVNKYGFHTVQRVIKEDIASGQFHRLGDLRPDTDDDVALVALERLRKKRERERNWE
jgi:hypothetical protein